MIRALEKKDYPKWLPLWSANCLGRDLPEMTQVTWQRICDRRNPIGGFGLWDEAGDLAAIVHYIIHPVTGQVAEVCYMQDVFVAEKYRRKGYAKMLITHLKNYATQQGWARIYWLAEQKNEAAQNLYKSIGLKLDFTLHVLPAAEI